MSNVVTTKLLYLITTNDCIMVVMKTKKNPVNIAIDDKTINLIDTYGEEHSLSRSATLRLIVNDFFLKRRNAL